MKKIILLTSLLFVSTFMQAQKVTGDWYGILEVPGVQLNITFHIEKSGDGISATMDSPDQGAFGIPAEATFQDPELKITVAAAGITYEGTYHEDKNSITGTFHQGGSIPLNLSREKKEKVTPARPQEPKPPFPYISKDVSFKNEEAQIKLSGTLTLPDSTGNFPAVILITGSGPQDRNQELFGHKPFLVLADQLTRNGIAVLRYDDRGYGESEGDFSSASIPDFASDVEAAIDFLKGQKGIDPQKIGLMGHSEGGIVAPMVAEESEDVEFIVMLAGPGMRGKELILLQKRLFEERSGVSAEEVAEGAAILGGAYDIILSSENDSLKPKLETYFRENSPEGTPKTEIDQAVNQLSSAGFSGFIKYDPAPTLKKIEIPVLALYGEKDFQVPPTENAAVVREALRKAGNEDFSIVILEDHNHMFQESTTGLLDEYAEIEQTISPKVLELITEWIREHAK